MSAPYRGTAGSILIFVVLLGVMTFQAYTDPTSEKIFDNGPTDKRMNIVFLSEGYTESELENFKADAEALLDYIMTVSPYDRYAKYFNGFIISVASNESGSTKPEDNVFRDTYFESRYGTGALRRLVTLAGDGMQRVFSLLQEFVPEYDIIVVIVNDPEYGGSGGAVSVTSVHLAAREIITHEVGHSFAGLTDEYSSPYPGRIPREFPNATSQTQRELIKWNHWFLDETPIPTPENPEYSAVVGLFEGAQYNATGWYRPKLNCKMRMLGVPFCEVCVEYHINSIYTLISPIHDYFPHEDQITLNDSDDEVLLGVILMEQDEDEITVRWYLDGNPVESSENMNAITVRGSDLTGNSTTIMAHVVDTTVLVRDNIIHPLLQDEALWHVTLTGVYDRAGAPVSFTLFQNFPNPFNPSTVIRFSLSQRHNVRLDLFNSLGQMVGQLIDEEFQHGYHEVTFDASHLTSGVYIYRMWAGEYVESKKLLLLK